MTPRSTPPDASDPAPALDGRTPTDPALDAPRTTVDALVQLSFLVQGMLARVATAHDLSLVQVRLLGILRDRRPGMLELARHLDLDKSSMTGLVARAEKRGLVRREPSPHDGRAVLVALTPEGRTLIDRCAAEMDARVAELTSPLSAGQHTQLRTLSATLLRPHAG
ncbi:MarR family transcriptional regulator [Streptomyces sp. J2-1]|uniref:MarR family winged helix-turn-helix transcriptional regulator n=1 Tax=Streptomyces corallincola TaxID=2851888 RepID=UPI001C38A21C|nr:MarR family transcriptional regulator [Streptomyces corallincola]MBV2355410.1 MarR family transcriptional regulator [Streptomyces corallincola]